VDSEGKLAVCEECARIVEKQIADAEAAIARRHWLERLWCSFEIETRLNLLKLVCRAAAQEIREYGRKP